jgi:flavodoxin
MKASIIYNSHTGTTKAFAEGIGRFLLYAGHRRHVQEDGEKAGRKDQ